MRREQQTRIRLGPRVDWPRVLSDIYDRGTTRIELARRLRLPRTTVHGWAELDAEPCHADGERIIALWIDATGLDRRQLPLSNVSGWLP